MPDGGRRRRQGRMATLRRHLGRYDTLVLVAKPDIHCFATASVFYAGPENTLSLLIGTAIIAIDVFLTVRIKAVVFSRRHWRQSTGALAQSDRSKRFTLPLAELTRRTRISSLLGAPTLLPWRDHVNNARFPTRKSPPGLIGTIRSN